MSVVPTNNTILCQLLGVRPGRHAGPAAPWRARDDLHAGDPDEGLQQEHSVGDQGPRPPAEVQRRRPDLRRLQGRPHSPPAVDCHQGGL